ncbi:MAG: isoprenyl transferase [Lachnospiraceae bacterium]|jgi:undecaprenyl diphosphate synthase
MADTQNLKLPNHLAIIMDGNGRWAQKRGLPRTAGHSKGCEVLEQTVRDCADIGIRYFTVYAFSTENWKRSVEEVSGLMQLFRVWIKRLQKVAMEENVRVRVIGERSRFAPDLVASLNEIELKTKDNTKMTFVMAMNYGARDEMRRAVTKIAKRVQAGELSPDDITEQTISEALDTRDIPDPDFLIRTSGEKRLSNFLLWQSAYTEFYSTPVLWPDYSKEELLKDIAVYGSRDRRFGGVTKTGGTR